MVFGVGGLLVALAVVAAGQVPDSAEEPPLRPIADVLVDADGDTIPDQIDQRVRVRGVITIPPGILAEEYFQVVVQDATAGISLFAYELSLPLQVGDEVEAVGVVGQYRGAVQLQEVAIEPLGEGTVPEPVALPAKDAASWEYYGRRVTVQGIADNLEITGFATMSLYGAEGGFLTVYFPSKVARGFPFQLYREGARIEATGVVSIYKPAWPHDSGFQIVVTSPDDLHVLAEPPPPWQIWVRWGIAAAVALLALTVLLFWVLHRRQRLREQELATLNALSSALSKTGVSRDELASRACEVISRHGIVDAASIHSFDEQGQLRLRGFAGIPPDLARRLDFTAESADAGNRSDPVAILDSERLAQQMGDKGLYLLSVVALSGRTRSLGILTALSRKPRKQSALQQRVLLAGAKLIALGLENIEVYQQAEADHEELKQLAITDDLTKLYNRRFLNEYLRIQMAMARRRGTSLAFLAVDLDHFKKINDTWGHDAGDQVLVRIADQIRDVTRASDLPVRYGGEEFLIVITDTDIPGAVAFAERLRQSIDATDFDSIVREETIKVTVSIGVAVYPIHGDQPRAVLRACDAALYQSKHGGRNRVTIAKEDAESND